MKNLLIIFFLCVTTMLHGQLDTIFTGTVEGDETGVGLRDGGFIINRAILNVDRINDTIPQLRTELNTLTGWGDHAAAGYLSDSTFLSRSYSDYFIAANNATAKEKSKADVVCDGTADQVQINAALTAGYNVKLSSGQFNIAGVITATVSNVTSEGSGKNKTIIYQSNGANANVITIGGNYWTIKNLLIDGNTANNTGTCHGIYGTGRSNILIDNCEIKNIEDYAVYIFGSSNSWYVANSYIHDVGTAIKGNTFSGQAPYNIYISYCHFHNTTTESQVYAKTDATGSYNWNVDHCRFTGTSGYMGLLFDLAKNSNVTNSYFAVDECPGAGVPANIRYYNGASGKITGNTFAGAGNTTNEAYAGICLWGVSDVVVSNNYFTSLANKDGTGISIEAYSTGYNVSNIVIDANIFYNLSTDVAKEAISLYSASTYVITNIAITNNVFRDDRGEGAMITYGVVTSDAGTVSSVNISNNIFDGLAQIGIFLQASISNNILVSGNIFYDLPTAIRADDGDDLHVFGNKFVTCAVPITFNHANVTRPLVSENTMYGCTNSGSYATATGELFGNNLWHDGTYDATAP